MPRKAIERERLLLRRSTESSLSIERGRTLGGRPILNAEKKKTSRWLATKKKSRRNSPRPARDTVAPVRRGFVRALVCIVEAKVKRGGRALEAGGRGERVEKSLIEIRSSEFFLQPGPGFFLFVFLVSASSPCPRAFVSLFFSVAVGRDTNGPTSTATPLTLALLEKSNRYSQHGN